MRVCRQCVPTFVSLNVSSVADLQTKNQFLAAEGRQYLTLKLNGEIFGFGKMFDTQRVGFKIGTNSGRFLPAVWFLSMTNRIPRGENQTLRC